ncbi:LOW QUALITY PROTEIN: hypothetical protein ACHAWF_001738 [Thalassiosira exigua]
MHSSSRGDILCQGVVVDISEIIIKTRLVNVHLADDSAVMRDPERPSWVTGVDKSRVTETTDASIAAISSPLPDFPIGEAKRVVLNVMGGSDLGLSEINAASEVTRIRRSSSER